MSAAVAEGRVQRMRAAFAERSFNLVRAKPLTRRETMRLHHDVRRSVISRIVGGQELLDFLTQRGIVCAPSGQDLVAAGLVAGPRRVEDLGDLVPAIRIHLDTQLICV
jgi:hypothetical protein